MNTSLRLKLRLGKQMKHGFAKSESLIRENPY
jgi:hypothetical protein